MAANEQIRLARAGARWFGAAVLLALSLLPAGCGRPAMKRLTFEEFPRRPKHAQIDLYIGRIERAKTPIAIINSISLANNDRAAKQRQLEYLKRRARRLGADAVEDIHILPRRIQGFVVDENVPFRAWKQGNYNLYMLRGTAVKYTTKQKEDGESTEFPLSQLARKAKAAQGENKAQP